MTLNPNDRKSIVEYELDKSILNLNQARANSELGFWDLVANRLYYAVFHAISALLISNGVPVKSHKGAVKMFYLHFVKTGLLSIKDGHTVTFLQAKREEADYNCFTQINEDEISPLIEECADLISKIEHLIKD